jgi:opacity protein-like surface antigen
MRAVHRVVVAGIGSLLLFTGTAWAADNGIYAGLSVGQAKTDFDDGIDDFFDGKDTAFKLVGGYRILDWLGVEVSYVDLGEITQRGDAPGLTRFRLEEAGFNVYGVLFYDIANFDVFAKAGLIQSQVHLTADSFFGRFDESDNSTDLAWGVGAQVRFGSLAARLEYERFELDAGAGFDTPDMISVGATWTFF